MFRTLFLLAAIIAVIYLIRRMLSNQKQGSDKSSDRTASPVKNIVQCQQCQVFIPEDEAVHQDGKTFCSQQHADEWTQK